MTGDTREAYASGFTHGLCYAEVDLHEHAATASEEEDLRVESRVARNASDRTWAAFKLGIVRGYRDATRTQLAGKWGS